MPAPSLAQRRVPARRRAADASQAEDLARLADRRRLAAVLGAELRDALHQRGVRRRELLLAHAHIVFQAGAAMAAELERPAIQRQLVLADAGARPGGARRKALERAHVVVEGLAI